MAPPLCIYKESTTLLRMLFHDWTMDPSKMTGQTGWLFPSVGTGTVPRWGLTYIKGIHNTVADEISRLDYGPIKDDRSNWMTFAQCWCYHNSTQQHKASIANSKESMNLVFANQNKEEAIYPLTAWEIAEAQQQDKDLKTGWKGRLLHTAGQKYWSTL